MTAWIANPLDPFGRMTRRAFALTLLICMAALLPTANLWWHGAVPDAVALGLAFVGLLALCCALSQRLHDIGVPGVLACAALLPGAGIALLVWALVWPGRRGPNRFGLDPRGWVV